MRTLIQRVQHASVTIDGQLKSKIGKGLLVLKTATRRKISNGCARRLPTCASLTMKTAL